MENKMETTLVYWGFYWEHIGIQITQVEGFGFTGLGVKGLG